MKRILFILLVALGTLLPCLAGAATSAPVDEDERRLWLQAREEEQRIDSSKAVYHSQEMERYLEKVIRNLVPADQLASMPIRVTIIRDRSCNAFMFPNGRAYIHTGMLAVMENEAQLATILAHESIHALNHHMVKEVRDIKGKTAMTAFLGAISGSLLTPFGQLGALAAVKGHSRELEGEADQEGFRLLTKAGYDPAEAPKVFEVLRREAQAEGSKEPYFFASHPRLQERIDNMKGLLSGIPNGQLTGKTNAELYLQTFGTLILDSAEMDLRAGRAERARDCVSRYLKARGDHPRAYLLLGESYRQDGKKPDPVKAREYYQKAAQLDSGYAEAHRLLGLVAYKQRDLEQARNSLGRYLELAPSAPDRGYIEQMLIDLQQRRP
ncbi:MAG TPA: M48 family metalloprotease [Geomonas sp.]|nr:M48 family metalloprotease [Geomonas sp.]